jgi:ATP-dependent helicase/nuclease subunit A
VADALRTLHELWQFAATQPADVVVAAIVDRFGLLPWAAAGELGDSRAGALLYVLETVRHAALQGDASLGGALTAIDAALSTEEAEAPLEPGRSDAVRVMNLHQAKGLEADVVVLAAPIGEWNPAPTLHVTRPETGDPQGRIVVAEKRFRFNDTILACPADWKRHAEEEQRFGDAERDRLLYVAATRAKDELLVARYEDDAQSPWSAFHPYLEMNFPRLELNERPAPERARLERSAASLIEETAAVDGARAALASPTYRADAVTRRVKSVDGASGEVAGRGGSAEETRTSDDGQRWGKLLHAALEEAGRGSEGNDLRAFTRTLVTDEDLLPRDLAPDEHTVDLIVAEVRKVTRSEIWQRAQRAAHRLIEVPFAIAFDTDEWKRIAATNDSVADAAGTSLADAAETPRQPEPRIEIVEGVIDLAFRDAGGWTLVDYKSDREGSALDEARRARYRAQVDLYATCWSRITGEPVRERVLLFVADGTTESW